MMCIQLNLAGAIEENVIFAQLLQSFFQPVYVVFQLFNGI
jgi:hypothetical protein